MFCPVTFSLVGYIVIYNSNIHSLLYQHFSARQWYLVLILIEICGTFVLFKTRISDGGTLFLCQVCNKSSITLDLPSGWLRGAVLERRSLTGKLSLSCARPAADG